jgi:hypothetical protein
LSLHNAPPVAYPLGRSFFLGGLLFGVWLAGVGLTLAWGWLGGASGVQSAVAGAVVLASGAMAAISWKNSPRGQLIWDGQLWRWKSASYQTGAADYELFVIADIQRCLLLRLENPAGTSLWLWAERHAAPERWLDLRRGVYSPHRSGGGAQARNLLAAEPDPMLSSPVPAVAVSAAMPPIPTPPAPP